MVLSFLNDSFHISTVHQFGDHVGLILVPSQVEDGDDVRMGAQSSHSLGFSADAGPGGFVQTLGLDQCKCYLTVQQGVVRQIDFLLPPSPKNRWTWQRPLAKQVVCDGAACPPVNTGLYRKGVRCGVATKVGGLEAPKGLGFGQDNGKTLLRRERGYLFSSDAAHIDLFEITELGWDSLAKNLMDTCHNGGLINYKEEEALSNEIDHRQTITTCKHVLVEKHKRLRSSELRRVGTRSSRKDGSGFRRVYPVLVA